MKPTYQQTHIDRPLTNISVGYRPEGFIARDLFASVNVQRISDLYFIYDKADWLRREVAVRAPGQKAARAGYGVSTDRYTCVEKAIAKPVTDESVDNSDAPLKPLADATFWVTDQIYLEVESDVASLAFGTGWAASSTPATLWDNPSSDPIADVETAISGIVGSIGRQPNVGAMGRQVWSKLKTHPEIQDKIRGAAGPSNPAAVTLAAVATLFELPKLLVGAAIENTANEGDTASMSYIWGKHVLVAYVAPNPGLQTPSAGYVFDYKAREVSRFREDQERQDIVECRQSWDSKIVAADAGYLLKQIIP
jgi:hypothetical protein